MNQDQITIIEPNGVQRTRPLTVRGLTIGREASNDLLISYDRVSRRHAQVIFDQGYYYVIDLNSANGTYLGNNRLAPNEPTVWVPGTPLSIGDVLIHLGQGQPEQPPQPAPAPAAGTEAVHSQRDKEDTFVGPTMGTPSQTATGGGAGRILLLLLLLLFLLCACVALGGGAYFYLFAE
jgi:predicted component of type VI protein secretion system